MLENHPDRDFVCYLLAGIKQGFDIGVKNLPMKSHTCRNNFSARKDPARTSELLKSELQKGYLVGPFKQPPFETYRINPISLAQKKFSQKKRLVVDMSAPHEVSDIPSLNSLISKEEFTLSYVKIDEAIKIIQKLGRGTKLCKTDLVDAFKTLPTSPDIWPFQGIRWKEEYYFFTRLVFGCRSSPKIFDTLSRAIAWIAKEKYGITNILYLLDDFLTLDEPGSDAERTMALLTMIFKKLNIKIAPHKTVGPTTELEYLGLTLDTQAMECRLPPDKLHRIKGMVNRFLGRSKCTKQEMLSLLGHLAFAARVIPPGRTFMARLFKAAYSVNRLHHRVYLGHEAKEDLRMWATFLNNWDGISLFIDGIETLAEDMGLYTDASGVIGYGGYFQGHWFNGEWSHDLLRNLERNVSISFQELYPIVVAAMLWGQHWKRKRIIFYCDNKGTVHILNKGRSKSSDIMKLMRRLTLMAAKFNFCFKAVFLPGRENSIADSLSRFQMERFRQLAPNADLQPCRIPFRIIFD